MTRQQQAINTTRQDHTSTGEDLPAPAAEKPMQGLWRREPLPAPAHQEQMQGLWRWEPLPAPANQWQDIILSMKDSPYTLSGDKSGLKSGGTYPKCGDPLSNFECMMVHRVHYVLPRHQAGQMWVISTFSWYPTPLALAHQTRAVTRQH